MKRFGSIVFCLLCAIFANSADLDKEFKKLIEKYDISDSAKVVEKNNPEKFWQSVLFYNEPVIKFIRDIKKKRGAENEALKKVSELPRFYPQYDESIIESLQGFCDTILIDMGISSLPVKCSLHVVYSDEVNSFNALTEDSFVICLTSALLQRKGITREIIIGFVANEFSHGALQHKLRGLYAGAKQMRKNKLSANIVSGINTFASGIESAMTGHAPDRLYNYLLDKDLKYKVKTSTEKYIFNYTKEQEHEADLIAFRFLEYFSGDGDNYINALRIMGSLHNHMLDNNGDDINSISSRINFLKYVQQHPELGNTQNAALRRSREKRSVENAKYKMHN